MRSCWPPSGGAGVPMLWAYPPRPSIPTNTSDDTPIKRQKWIAE